jgi:hypothetical protein
VIQLSPVERTKLAKMLGMLGSDHAGEREAAAHAATSFLKARGLCWEDVLSPPSSGDQGLYDLAGRWREAAATCALRGAGILTPWEFDFARNLVSFSRCTDKPLGVLRRLIDKVLLAEAVS